MRRRMQQHSLATLATLAAGGLLAATAAGQLPMTGVPVPALSGFDDAMQDVMDEFDISAGVLAVSRNGCVVYQRGFGSMGFPLNTVPENTPMRVASCEKPVTSAAIRRLIADGLLDWDEFLFDLGQAEGGVLPHTPHDGVGDSRLLDVTIEHAFDHRGGWDRDLAPIGDPQFAALEIADELNVTSPPGRVNTIRFMLSEPLEFNPGTNGCLTDEGAPTYCYSNFGYMCLARAVEERSGLSYLSYVRSHVLTPDMWVPASEIFSGRTLAGEQSWREPYYDAGLCVNVFNGGLSNVGCPYGGWEIEAFIGHGNLVMSAVPMLRYLDHYQVGVGGAAGTPLDEDGPNRSAHTGGMDGTTSVMRQRTDGINIVVLFNKRGGDDNYAALVASAVEDVIDGGVTWPSDCVDGAWVDFGGSLIVPELGGYNHPYRLMATVASNASAGTKLRLKPGVGVWSGTLNKKLRIDAPLGTARIGG